MLVVIIGFVVANDYDYGILRLVSFVLIYLASI